MYNNIQNVIILPDKRFKYCIIYLLFVFIENPENDISFLTAETYMYIVQYYRLFRQTQFVVWFSILDTNIHQFRYLAIIYKVFCTDMSHRNVPVLPK